MIKAGDVYLRKVKMRRGPQMMQLIKVLGGPDRDNNYSVEYFLSDFGSVRHDKTKFFHGLDDAPKDEGETIKPIEEVTSRDLRAFILRIFNATKAKGQNG